MKKIIVLVLLLAVSAYGADSVWTIAASGADHTTLKAAVVAHDQDITEAGGWGTGDKAIFYIIGNFADTGATGHEVWLNNANWTTDDDNYIIVYTADSCRSSNGVWDDDKYMIGAGTYTFFIGSDLKVYIHGLQVIALGTSGNNTISDYGDGTKIYDCMLRNYGIETGARLALRAYGEDNSHYYFNNLIYDYINISTSRGIYVTESADSSVFVYNNTFANNSIGIDGIANKIVAKNNIFWGCPTRTGSIAFGTGTGWNATDSSSFEYSNSSGNDSVDAEFSFTNSGADQWTLTAEFAGTDLSSDPHLAFSTDVLGTTRTVTWCRGFHEYDAPSGKIHFPGGTK